MGNSIYHSSVIYNRLIQLNLGQIFSSTVMKHILSILISVFLRGYRGKTVDFACASPCHRTTIAHFLNRGKWDDAKLERILKEAVVRTIDEESLCSVLWMIRFLRKQSLHHGSCIQSKMRISINLISNAGRIMDIRQFPSCFPVIDLSLIMPRSCTTNQSRR